MSKHCTGSAKPEQNIQGLFFILFFFLLTERTNTSTQSSAGSRRKKGSGFHVRETKESIFALDQRLSSEAIQMSGFNAALRIVTLQKGADVPFEFIFVKKGQIGQGFFF